MKIGILTAARTNNNGTDLQAFAMQNIFSRFCNNVEVINYKCDKLENSRKVLPSISVKNIVKIPIKMYKNISHSLFRKRYINYSLRYYDKKSLKDTNYDRFVVGSDQIWNLDITGNDLNFFLPFKSCGKKYSYAASLGKTDIVAWQNKYDLGGLLEDFEEISLREQSGVQAMEKIGVIAKNHLDPLLMVSSEKWKKMCKGRRFETPYVFVYTAQSNDKALKFAREYAKKHNMKVYMYNDGVRPFKGIKSLRFLSVNGFLNVLNNAELIVTNSYHGLSLAINLHKNFRVFALENHPQSNSRMLDLLEKLHLENYIIQDNYILNEQLPPWEDVEKKLKPLRDSSCEYIKEICR
ncbi:MAG: polysaccharide pyruvyl transferase family protein [Clostridia bacterium]|nr:polysaccharide pyruvyl transferase family protein [Clostridia bacterium]